MTKRLDRVLIPEAIRQKMSLAAQGRLPLVPQLIQKIKPYIAQQAKHQSQARGKNKGAVRQKH